MVYEEGTIEHEVAPGFDVTLLNILDPANVHEFKVKTSLKRKFLDMGFKLRGSKHSFKQPEFNWRRQFTLKSLFASFSQQGVDEEDSKVSHTDDQKPINRY